MGCLSVITMSSRLQLQVSLQMIKDLVILCKYLAMMSLLDACSRTARYPEKP